MPNGQHHTLSTLVIINAHLCTYQCVWRPISGLVYGSTPFSCVIAEHTRVTPEHKPHRGQHRERLQDPAHGTHWLLLKIDEVDAA